MTHSLAELALAANLQQKQLSSYCAVETCTRPWVSSVLSVLSRTAKCRCPTYTLKPLPKRHVEVAQRNLSELLSSERNQTLGLDYSCAAALPLLGPFKLHRARLSSGFVLSLVRGL
jgi:hypothetical protein